MRKEVIYKYIAEDGTEFDNKYDCTKYELDCKKNIGFKAFDYYGKQILNDNDTESIWYVSLPNKECVEYFISRCEYEGISSTGIEGVGNYFYSDDYDDRWYTLESFIEHIKSISNYLQAEKIFKELEVKK